MHRKLGLLGKVIGGLATLSLLACPKPGEDLVALDQGEPRDTTKAEIIAKCQSMTFDTSKASVVQPLDSAGTVLVKIIPADSGYKTKLKHLASKKGRIIAKVVNEGDGTWRSMALVGKSASCWFVWGDKDERLLSKFVPLNGGDEAPDASFDIEFHRPDHTADLAQWNRPFMGGMTDSIGPSQVPPSQLQDTIMRGPDYGWTTCLVNGCCRSRQ